MSKIIVSCTTTKDRLDLLYYTIQSIKHQELHPDEIHLNISKEAYLSDKGINLIPEWLKQEPIHINWVENIGPYRKIIPIIKYIDENDLLITFDDDILYSFIWLKSLVDLYEKHPNHIVCARAREMKKNNFGRWQNYSRWNLISSAKEGLLILPTNGAGTVFRKNLLDLDFLLNPAFKEIAPTTDDLWFRMASLRKNMPVLVDPGIDNENIYLRHNKGLYRQNYKIYNNSFFTKIYKNTIEIIIDWIGINNSKNDFSWSRIVSL